MKRGRGEAWTAFEDAEILNGLALGKTDKGIAKLLPDRTLAAVQFRVKVLTRGKERRPSGVAMRLSMRIPAAIHEQWKIEAELLGMTLSRYVREKLVGGRA